MDDVTNTHPSEPAGPVCSCYGGCRGCAMHGHGRHYLLRWLLGILILLVVFFIGIKIGEFSQEIRSGDFYPGMMMHGRSNMNRYYNNPMPYSGTGTMPEQTMPSQSTNTVPPVQTK